MWDLDELRGGRRICCGHSGRQGSPYVRLSKRSGGEDVGIMMNANVSDSAAATQQHLVLHRALVYIQEIGGGPVGESTRTQPAELEKVVGIRGTFVAVSLIPSPPTMAAEVVQLNLHSLLSFWIPERRGCVH